MNLLTSGQQFSRRKKDALFVSREMYVYSELFWSMPKTAIRVYTIFRNKCVVEKIKARPGVSEAWIIKNNGEIQFTYREAKDKFGIHHSAFTRAIDSLVETGFIDLDHQGQGTRGDNSRYAISNRWMDFGTNEFKVRTRTKRQHGYGRAQRFTPGTVEDYIRYPTKQVKTIAVFSQNSRVRSGMIPP